MTHYRKPAPRTIINKFSGKCWCCGGNIPAGQSVTYYPPFTYAANIGKGVVTHLGATDGDSAPCHALLTAGHMTESFTMSHGKYEGRARVSPSGDNLWISVVYLSGDPIYPFGEVVPDFNCRYVGGRVVAERAFRKYFKTLEAA